MLTVTISMPWYGWYALGFFVLGLTFLIYAAASDMQARAAITGFWWPFIAVTLLVGLPLDLAFNATAGWLMFLESPFKLLRDYLRRISYLILRYVLRRDAESPHAELTFSMRVRRIYRDGYGWRLALATWWRKQLKAAAPYHI